MDQRPDFDEGQNDQEITNDEKLGLVEISFFFFERPRSKHFVNHTVYLNYHQ